MLSSWLVQGLSNICWAHAKLGAVVTEEVARLLEALAVEAVSQLMDIRSRQKFIPQVRTPACCPAVLHIPRLPLAVHPVAGSKTCLWA